MRTVALFLAVVLGCASGPSPTKRPSAAAQAELEPLQFFVGDWRVTAHLPGDQSFEFDWHVEARLGGHWLVATSAGTSSGLRTEEYWGVLAEGFDARVPEGELSRYVRVYFDNTGARAEVTSPGWAGGTMVWNGRLEARDGAKPVRSIVERTSDETFQVQWQRLDGDGWVTRRTEVYERR